MDVDPTVARAHGFPFGRVIHLGDCILIGRNLLCRHARRTKEPTPVHELGFDPLFHHGGGIGVCADALWCCDANDFDFTRVRQINRLGKAGGQGRNFAGQQGCHGFAACVIGNVLYSQRVFASGFHDHGCDQVVHAAWHRAAANCCRRRIGVIGCQQVCHRIYRAVLAHHDGCVITNGARDQRQVAEVLRENARERADDDGRRVDHQRPLVAVRILDQKADGLAAAAARHVFVGCRADQTCACQGFARTACCSVPTATGTTGDQKVDAVDDLMAIRHCLSAKAHGQRSTKQGPTAQFKLIHVILPFDIAGFPRE